MINKEGFERFYEEYRKEGFRHSPYKDIDAAILNADIDFLEKIDWNKCSEAGAGKMSDNPVMQARLLMANTVTTAQVFAVANGVDYEIMASLVDYYFQACQKTNSVAEITMLSKSAVIHICEYIKEQKELPRSQFVHQVARHIHNRVFSRVTVSSIAEDMGIKLPYLSKRFKEEAGISIKEYIQKEKLREAEKLMRHTDMSITQIAYQLGFSDASHFTRVCKAYKNCTPKELKASVMEIKKLVER